MYYRSMFPGDIFSEMNRLQRALQQSLDSGPSIRGLARGFPAVNVGGTPSSVEVYVFAPGIEPSALEVLFEKNTLSIAGERNAPEIAEKATMHINERFAGRFRRVISLPDDVDPNSISARYRDGVLHVHIARTAEARPRRIAVQ